MSHRRNKVIQVWNTLNKASYIHTSRCQCDVQDHCEEKPLRRKQNILSAKYNYTTKFKLGRYFQSRTTWRDLASKQKIYIKKSYEHTSLKTQDRILGKTTTKTVFNSLTYFILSSTFLGCSVIHIKMAKDANVWVKHVCLMHIYVEKTMQKQHSGMKNLILSEKPITMLIFRHLYLYTVWQKRKVCDILLNWGQYYCIPAKSSPSLCLFVSLCLYESVWASACELCHCALKHSVW